MTTETEPTDGIFRRTVLKATAVATGAFALSGTAAGHDDYDDEKDNDDDDDYDDNDDDLDEPDGFEVEILGAHAPFTDDVAATFTLDFADEDDDDDDDGGVTIGAHLDDASTFIVAEVTWEPGGTSGWHRHPGVAIVNILEGDLEVTWEHDCVARTYSEGEAFFDPGEVHIADNVSDDDEARAYVIFLGVPDGEPATEWVEPVDC